MKSELDTELDSPEVVDELSRLLQSHAHPLPSAERTEAISEQCSRSLEPAKSLRWWPRIGISVALCLLVMVVFVGGRGLPWQKVPPPVLYGLSAWGLVQVGMLVMGLGQTRPLTHASRAVVAVGVPGAFLLFLAVTGESVALSAYLTDSWLVSVLHCGLFSLASGIVTALAVMWIWRRSDPFHPSFSGSVVGLVGGLGGAMAAGLVCQEQITWHLWLGHGLSVVLLVALGHVVGRRWLAP